jgi:hypothetical protein
VFSLRRCLHQSAAALSRRQWLRLGALSALGLAVPPWGWLARAAGSGTPRPSPGFGKARAVILLYTSGGQSQIDTWDPKPNAPAEVRGEFRPMRTAVPGTWVGEYLPRLARLADRYTIHRSVAHDDTDHGSATYLALTGQYHPKKSSNPLPHPTDFPTYGALLKRVRPAERFPHTAVHVNGPALVPEIVAPGQFGGFLGHAYDPLVLGDVTEGPVVLRGLEPEPDVPPDRLDGRRALQGALEGGPRAWTGGAPGDLEAVYRQAYDLLASPRYRRAFDLESEPPALRERYGLYRAGQACLLARRLVEAGVPWVTVMCNHTNRGQDKAPDDIEQYGWDTHNDIFEALKVRLLPRFDWTFSALLEDLEQRGLLDSTLVVCMGEFGRAPQVALERTFAGTSPGRKHWAAVYSVVVAGAGVARGGLVGASDRSGAYPQASPVGPWDLAATMFAALGVDPHAPYPDPGGRPFPLTTGRAVAALYG